MSRTDRQRVGDILDASAELADVVDCDMDEFLASPLRQRAAERLLEIIGECANSLSEGFVEDHDSVPWRDMSRLRIVLAHHYHRVDPMQVWAIATESVPAMVAELAN